ncbi:MAG: hypothetical protein AAF570_06725 [Bacteroidota bacterium]
MRKGVFYFLATGLLIWGAISFWGKSTPPEVRRAEIDAIRPTARFSDDVCNPKIDTRSAPYFLGGVQIKEEDQVQWVKELIHSGMNTVEVTVYAQQGRWFDNNLWFEDISENTLKEIRTAKAAGMKVVLILRMRIDHAFPENKFLWHGMIYPETEYLLNRWFENYSRFARMYAKMAEREDVDVFVIGSEMNAVFASRPVSRVPDLEQHLLSKKAQNDYLRKMLRLGKTRLTSNYLSSPGEPNYTDLETYLRDKSECHRNWASKVACVDSKDQVACMNRRRAIHYSYWNKLIWGLKDIYHGKLTVAANFDNYDQIVFWPDLDMVGINAYFPLRTLESDSIPVKEQMVEGWKREFKKVLHYLDTLGVPNMPVLITELGYTRYSGSTIAPWKGHGFSLLETAETDSLIIWDQQPIDLAERNAAIEALKEAVRETNFPLAGILYWKFTSMEEQVKEDPFALQIGTASEDKLPGLLKDVLMEN